MPTKNPFATPSPAPSSAGSSITAAEKAKKRWELEQGRTNTKVEELMVQLDNARRTLANANQAYGEREIDGLDTSEATMQRAEGRVCALEATLTVAKQKDESAQAQLANAKQHVHREHLRELLTLMQDAGHPIQETFDQLTAQIAILAPLMDALRALGVDAINHQLTSAALAFKPRLLNACGLMPGCRTAEAWFMKDEPWVESLPKPSDADQVK